MAPEDTMTTLCPSRRSLTAVSTMRLSMGSRGVKSVSLTIEELPMDHELLSSLEKALSSHSPTLITIVNFFCFVMVLNPGNSFLAVDMANT